MRVKNHYTREAFAEIIGISTKFLYEIETGKKGFSANTLYKIATSFGVSCDYIITGK
ncbi:MAG: helix-turn-helix transcriptional regulator [Lachnospiraceae bacterium]|nr:helix-turn-helix transcriptional regulator [Lachnospiraceae bacterium]